MFYVIRVCSDHRNFIEHCNKAMLNYKSNIHCIVFLERLQELITAGYERHSQFCTADSLDQCRFSTFYHVVLFYIKNKLEYQEQNLPFTYFKKNERRLINQEIEDLVSMLPTMKMSSRGNLMKLKMEISEMKSYYFLDKKNWKQLFLGKLTVLENTEIITREQSSKLLEKIEDRFLLPT